MADGKKTAWRWYLLIGLPIVLVVASALVYWLYPRTTYFYYGGGETWEASESSPPRLVMWKEPEALTEKVNAGPQTYEPSLGPQGLKLYFTLGLAGKNADIFVADRQGDEWVNPRPVRAVNTQYDEIGASVSPDGTRMYFYSNRPGGQGGYDLWVSERQGGSWQKPANLGPDVNSGASEYDPSVSPDGKYLLFSSNRAGKSTRGIWSVTLRERKGIKDFDIYLLELSVKPPKPHRLAALNTPANEGQPVVSPRGDFVYFASDRPGGHGGYDIWRARISDKPFKSFQTPENLGPEVNTADHEMDPTITVEGFGLYLASNREGDYEIFHVASTEVQKYAVKETLNWDMIVGKLGWPVIGLFVALLGLALLLFAMLKFRHRPGLLATSLGVSVLLHLLALFLFSLYMVQQRISELADDPSKYKLSLNLPDLEESELSESIRKKILELAMTDARKFEEKKTVKVETAEVKVAKAKPRMVHSRPDAPRREEIKFEPVTRPERTVEAEIQVATKVRMQTVDHLLMPARMLRKETRAAKTTGERVEAPKVTFRYSKIKAAPTVTPSPTMVEPKLARTVARSPSVSLARMNPEVTELRPVVNAKVTRSEGKAVVAIEEPLQLRDNMALAAKATRTKETAKSAPTAREDLTTGRTEDSFKQAEHAATKGVAVASVLMSAAAPAIAGQHSSLAKGGKLTQASSVPSAIPSGADIETGTGKALDISGVTLVAGRISETREQKPAPETKGGGEAEEAMDGTAREGAEMAVARFVGTDPLGEAVVAIEGPKATGPAFAVAPVRAQIAVEAAEVGKMEVQGEIEVSTEMLVVSQTAVDVAAPPTPLPVKHKKAIYRARNKEARIKLVKAFGGSEKTEEAVENALEWLAKNQSDDGRWDLRDFKSAKQIGGEGGANQPIAVTGLAVLAFLSADYTQIEGKHKETVRKALAWLMANQREDGYFFVVGRANSMYAHGMATAALCEAYSMTEDAKLLVSAQKAAGLIMDSQNALGGWRYAPNSKDSDTSVVGWQVLALKSAEFAGIPVPKKHYDGVAKWLDSVRHGTSGGFYKYSPGGAGGISMTPEGWFCQLFISDGKETRGTAESIKYVMSFLPKPGGGKNAYFWYYATMALHLAEVKESEKWNVALSKTLLPLQRKDGAAAGSWDPAGYPYGPAGGRVYVTVLNTLCLEVHYRYLPLLKTRPK